MPSPLAEVLADLATGLDRLGVSWYLFGAQAAVVHGVTRLTADVDVTVALGSRGVAELVTALAARGLDLRMSADDDFLRRTRVLPFRHAASGIPVDSGPRRPGAGELFLRRATRQEVAGVPVPVAAVEDLVAMKLLAGRAKDLDDAAAMLACRWSTLDQRLLRGTLRKLEAALGPADLVAELERLLARVQPQRP